MSRLKAATLHLLISSAVLLLLACITVFVWYPNPHYKYEGVLTILGLIALVDVVLGPIFTFIVFKSGKPSLKMDLTVIAVIQITAFIYGSTVIYSQHPEFVTYVEGVMITVPASAIDEQKVDNADLKRRFHIGPKLAVTRLPDDPKAVIEFKIAQVTKNKQMIDFPMFYRSFPPDMTELAEKSLNIQQLYEKPQAREKIQQFLNSNNLSENDIFLLRLVNHLNISIMVLDKKTGLPIGYLDIQP